MSANATSKWMKKLSEMSGMVDFSYNPFLKGVRSSSPSVNFIFGNTQMLPEGYSAIFAGEFKAGKTVLALDFVGQMHTDDPDGVAVVFDTEGRYTAQFTPLHYKNYRVDTKRLVIRATNRPDDIFNFIANEIAAMCQEGVKVRLIVIDSVTAIMGRRALDSKDGVMTMQRGDEALTIQDGLKHILDTIRHNKISLIMTTQLRSEQDPNKAKYTPTKMAGSWAFKHFAEYFLYLQPVKNAEGKKTLDGEEMVDDRVKDLKGKKEELGHKIFATMKDSTLGPKSRVGEFSLDYRRGIINTYEEAFLLSIGRGIVERPNNRTYVLKDFPKKGEETKWTSKDDFLGAVKANVALADELVKRVKEQDVKAQETGEFVVGATVIADDDVDVSALLKNADNEEADPEECLTK